MSRKPEDRLVDIRRSCEKILRYTNGMDRDRFADDDLVMDAVLQNIEIIGEAAKNLPEDVRAKMPAIEWRKITGMRDMLSHAYYRVDPGIVWDVVENKVPELLRAVQGLQGEVPPAPASQDPVMGDS